MQTANKQVAPESPPADQERAVILIVDDTPTNIQILALGLRERYEIRVATNGEDALAALRRDDKPDLILLDVMMPGMDGYELCHRIKREPSTWDIPLIFITAKSDVADQQHGFDLGAVDYITKPFEMPLVLARVGVHIRLRRQSRRLEELSLLDALTDVPNRRALQDALARECGRAHRENLYLTVAMVDIDHFKAFNDHYGHGAGDDCLIRVASALTRAIRRPGDVLARYGGEEFCVILPNCDPGGAIHVAESLRQAVLALALPHAASPTADIVSISVGYTCRETVAAADCPKILLQEADRALYAAKSQGRNQTACWQKLSDALSSNE